MRFSSDRKIALMTIICSLLLCTGSFAQTPYLLNDTTIIHRLDKQVDVFIDSTNRLLLEQISKPEFQKHFHRRGNLTFGYLKSSLWLKIKTKTYSLHTNWYLEIPAPFIEYVDFYQLEGERWYHSAAGYYRKHSVREIPHTGHVLPLQFNKEDSISTVYIHITGNSPKTFPVLAIEKEKFHEQVRWEDVGYGIFFGILLVMFFYNLFIYFSLHQGNYLLYICTIICTFFIFSSASGYGGKFLWPEQPVMNFYAGRLSLAIITVFLSIFTIRFLEVRKYSLVMYFILLSLLPLAIVAALLIVTGTLYSAGNNLITLSTLVYMATGIVCRIKGNKTANFFIAAWTIYLTGGLLLTLRNSGVFDFNFWTTHFAEIGATMETVIIALALADRYRKLRKEKEEAQREALLLQQNATEKLEEKVKERTEQLSRANQELNITLETNRIQTNMIEKKNAELDAFFYRISHDLKGPISTSLGLSFLARKEIKDELALEYIDRQQQLSERLNHIITGLINLTKLNHTDLKKEKIDFIKLVDECIESSRSLPHFNAITFTKDIQNNIEFHSEWTLLNAIIQNLIENAVKYSGPVSPFVKITVRCQGEWVTIDVQDNGQGIPDEHQSKIFEMFYRATQNSNGTGLGLYILKRSVDRLKGTIEMKSKLGTGSVFTVKLPSMMEDTPVTH